MATCGMCYGKGKNLKRQGCTDCGEKGYVITASSDYTGQRPCSTCSGNGFYPVEVECERCKGTGVVPDE